MNAHMAFTCAINFVLISKFNFWDIMHNFQGEADKGKNPGDLVRIVSV